MKKKTKLPNVSVTTLPNGYALTFDGMRQPKGYLYFTLEDLLKGYGWKPYFVEGDDPMTMHRLMAETMDKVIEEILAIQKQK